ncbi:MAG: hypothetical protein AB1324_01360, partial [Candidatus Micrarchaeota archaeon]
SMNPAELSRLDPAVLGQMLEARGVGSVEATRIAAEIAPRVNTAATDFRNEMHSAGFNWASINALGDASALAGASRTGSMMSDDRLPDFVASRPDLIARLPPTVAEPASEYAYLSRQINAHAGMMPDQNNPFDNPPPPGTETGAAIDRISELNRGRIESAGFDTAQQVVPASRLGPEYVEERGRLDAGLHYYSVEDRFGSMPATAPPGLPEPVASQLPTVAGTTDSRLGSLRSYIDAEGPTDVGSARSIVLQEYNASREMERAARAAGDTDAAALFSRRAEGCSVAMDRLGTVGGRGSDEQAASVVDAITGAASTSEYADAVVRTRDALRGIQTGEREVPGRERPPVGDFPTPPPVRREPGSPPRGDEGESRMA